MATGNLTTTKSMVYQHLNVDGGTYGTYVSNVRYPSAYIEAEILNADIRTCQMLIKNGQELLMQDSWEVQNVTTTGTAVSQNWVIVGVEYNTGGGVYKKAVEIPWHEYEQISQGGIFDISTYKGYYTIQSGKIYFIGTDVNITYINLDRSGSLRIPDGFEPAVAYLASSILLMKRSDQPEQSTYYYTMWKEFIGEFLTSSTNRQEVVND